MIDLEIPKEYCLGVYSPRDSRAYAEIEIQGNEISCLFLEYKGCTL